MQQIFPDAEMQELSKDAFGFARKHMESKMKWILPQHLDPGDPFSILLKLCLFSNSLFSGVTKKTLDCFDLFLSFSEATNFLKVALDRSCAIEFAKIFKTENSWPRRTLSA